MSPLRIDLLLASGAMEGPNRRPHPVTLSRWRLIVRALRARRFWRSAKPKTNPKGLTR